MGRRQADMRIHAHRRVTPDRLASLVGDINRFGHEIERSFVHNTNFDPLRPGLVVYVEKITPRAPSCDSCEAIELETHRVRCTTIELRMARKRFECLFHGLCVSLIAMFSVIFTAAVSPIAVWSFVLMIHRRREWTQARQDRAELNGPTMRLLKDRNG